MSSTEPTASSLLSSARRPGVVVRVDRATALIEFPAVPELVRVSWGPELLAAINQEPEATPTVGDRAEVRYWPDGRVTLTRVAPRRTLLTRADADGGSRRQVLAANVDVVAVVEGLVPDPDGRRIARLLALAWASGAEPVVLLTKADLAPHQAQIVADLTAVSNCPVVAVSALERTGIEPVRALLAGDRLMALLGASGAGKSSLINALAGQELMRVRALRRDGKGRHTTVTRELHRVAGGFVIDGPGLRSVALNGSAGLELTFADVLAYADGCRFGDCTHTVEPGCAVLAAVDDGELAPDRVEAWRQLMAEGLRQEMRRDARLRAELKRTWKSRSKSLRRAGQDPPGPGAL